MNEILNRIHNKKTTRLVRDFISRSLSWVGISKVEEKKEPDSIELWGVVSKRDRLINISGSSDEAKRILQENKDVILSGEIFALLLDRGAKPGSDICSLLFEDFYFFEDDQFRADQINRRLPALKVLLSRVQCQEDLKMHWCPTFDVRKIAARVLQFTTEAEKRDSPIREPMQEIRKEYFKKFLDFVDPLPESLIRDFIEYGVIRLIFPLLIQGGKDMTCYKVIVEDLFRELCASDLVYLLKSGFLDLDGLDVK